MLTSQETWATQNNDGSKWMFIAYNGYDNSENVVSQTEGFGPGVPWNNMTFLNGQFQYDGLNRLFSVTDTNYTRTYHYDEFGNQSIQSYTGISPVGYAPLNTNGNPFNPATNHMVSVDAAGGYERRGMVTKLGVGPTVSMDYDAEGNMKDTNYGVFIEALMGGALDSAWGVHTSDVAGFNNPAGTSTAAAVYKFPYAFPTNLAQPGSQSFYQAFDVNYKDPIVQEWDMTLEQDLGKGYSLRASYDGNHGSHLGLLTNVNELPSNTSGLSALSSSAPCPLWNYIAYQRSIGVSNYNAATIALQKRFAHGFQFQGSYIFARNLSNNGGYDPTTFTGENGGTVTDQFHPGLDYGNVSFTRKNRFLLTFLYKLPFGKGKAFANSRNGLVDRLVGGWELAGVAVYQTGPYMTILAGGDPAGNGFPALVGDGRADTVKGVSPCVGQSLNAWINPAAFATPQNNIGRIADSAVGAVTGPGTQAVSMSLFKAVAITERLKVQVGASAANAFNHANYALPGNLTLGTSGFASVTNLQSAEGAGPRSLQLTARIMF